MAADPSSETFDVVFVCTGNRARSPLAKAFLEALVEPTRVVVSSRGTLRASPAPALPEAVLAGAARGVDLSTHRSVAIARGELAGADLVVGFEPFHVATAVMDGGVSHARAFTILELAGILERLDTDVLRAHRGDPGAILARAHEARSGPVLSAPALADPFGASQKEFDRVAEMIEQLVATIAWRLFVSR